MKRSQPSLRPRHRYIAVSLAGPGTLAREGLAQALLREARELFGDSGAAAIDLRVEEFLPAEAPVLPHGAVLRAVRERVDEARAALTVLREAEGKPVAARTLAVSGTLRGARRRLEKLKGPPVQ